MRDTGCRPGGDTGGGVVGRDRVVDVNDQAGLVSGVLAGDRGGRAGGAGSVTGDRQLGAADVVLRTLELLSRVQGDVLGAEQVVTGGEVGWQVQGDVGDSGASWWVLHHSMLVTSIMRKKETIYGSPGTDT